jgi:hypothetical protein
MVEGRRIISLGNAAGWMGESDVAQPLYSRDSLRLWTGDEPNASRVCTAHRAQIDWGAPVHVQNCYRYRYKL